jgi:hypothetical protein
LRHDGELAMVIGGQVDAARRTLHELLAQHLGRREPAAYAAQPGGGIPSSGAECRRMDTGQKIGTLSFDEASARVRLKIGASKDPLE